jgi:hypothetical protein
LADSSAAYRSTARADLDQLYGPGRAPRPILTLPAIKAPLVITSMAATGSAAQRVRFSA